MYQSSTLVSAGASIPVENHTHTLYNVDTADAGAPSRHPLTSNTARVPTTVYAMSVP